MSEILRIAVIALVAVAVFRMLAPKVPGLDRLAHFV